MVDSPTPGHQPAAGSRPVKGVLFDLLSALIDSWSLWDDLAGGAEMGRVWRMRYLDITYETGAYQPYLPLVARAARDVGLPVTLADEMEARWQDLRPWPEAADVVRTLGSRFRTGVVTNCSERLGQAAAALVGTFDSVTTAERAGWYKPDPRTYAAALARMDLESDEVVFVAGSPFDVPGAAGAGMRVIWHNRIGIAAPDAASLAESVADDLEALLREGPLATKGGA